MKYSKLSNTLLTATIKNLLVMAFAILVVGCGRRQRKWSTLSEARVVIAEWRKKYNELRPHRSLGMKTPEEFALGWEPGERWRAQHVLCV
jgi:transposase InsO family protein